MSGPGPPSRPALYPPAPSSPGRFRRNRYYGDDSQRPRSKTPLLGRKLPTIWVASRKQIYTISGREPIFSVETSLDFTVKVENQYLLTMSGLASYRPPKDVCVEATGPQVALVIKSQKQLRIDHRRPIPCGRKARTNWRPLEGNAIMCVMRIGLTPTRSTRWPAARKFVAFLSQISPIVPTQPTIKALAVNILMLASFHGMEEVTGSIPVRSTNNPL